MQYQFPELKEKFQNLPEDIQDAISSVSVGNTMEDVGEKHHLHLDQINELYDETGLVMLGLTHPKDYIKNLQNRLVIDFDFAKKIAADINEQIFRPIRESLKKVHNIEDEETRNEKQETVAQTPPQTELGKIIPPGTQEETAELELKEDENQILRLKKEPLHALRDRVQSFPPLQTYAKEPESEEKNKPPFFKITPSKQESGIKNYELRKKDGEKDAETEIAINHLEKSVPPPDNLPVKTDEQKTEIIKQEERFPAQVSKTLVPEDSIGEKLSRPFTMPRTETEYKGGDPYQEKIE